MKCYFMFNIFAIFASKFTFYTKKFQEFFN